MPGPIQVPLAQDPRVSPRIDKLKNTPVETVTRVSWVDVAKDKCADRELALDKFPQWRLRSDGTTLPSNVMDLQKIQLSEQELEIIRCDATSIVEQISRGQWTSVLVCSAFCHAAALAQDTTNCLTEIFFEEGLQRAEELDRHYVRTGKVLGPLHGLPVSIKDHIMIKDKDTSTGYISWCYNSKAENDAVAVDILRKAGAILYVKTNNPQTLLSLETDNNIFGRTCNPYNRDHTPGGSSGGESALIASLGSPMGIGTDIGGSIRIPAAHTGLYGLKPSVGRLPHAGLRGSHDGMEAIIGALGPITRSARDLELFCRIMLDAKPWLIEPPIIEIPWKTDVANGQSLPDKLSFAILLDDEVVKPHPPILDALARTKRLLEVAGHSVILWKPKLQRESWELITKLYFLDGGKEYRDVLAESGEPPVPQTEWIMSHVPDGGQAFSIGKTFALNKERERIRTEVAKQWNATHLLTGTGRPVDAIISAVAPTLAPVHNTTRWWGYTSFWNLVDYPAVVFPVGIYNCHEATDVSSLATSKDTISNGDSDIAKFTANQWSPRKFDGLPISLQLIGRRLNEERLLATLKVVEAAIGSAAEE